MEEKFESTADYKTYSADKEAFFKAHDYDFKSYTSPLDQYNRYHKEYCFSDGAVWYEICGPVTVKENITVKFVDVQVSVDLFRVEYYSTDCCRSKYYHERYDVREVS